jgi:hypothetical protein
MSVYHEPNLSYDKRRTALITVAGLVLAIAVIACLYFIFNPRINAAPLNTTIASISQNPKDLLGRTVVVPGKVVSVLNDSAFTVVDPDAAAGIPVLVVSRNPIPIPPARPTGPALLPGDNVSLSGQVRRYTPDEKVNGVDLARSEYAQFNGQPFVLASAVAPPGRTTVVVTPHAVSPAPRTQTVVPPP